MAQLIHFKTRDEAHKVVTDLTLRLMINPMEREVARFLEDTHEKQRTLDEVSRIVGYNVGGELGELRIADFTNRFIDRVTDLIFISQPEKENDKNTTTS